MNAILEKELEDLEEILENAEDIQEVEGGILKIKDLDTANWALKKLKSINEKKKEIEELARNEIEPYQLEISRINLWKENELKAFDKSVDFFNSRLEEFYKEQRAIDPKYKLSTPYGKVTSRKQQPEWIYDNEKIVEWLKVNEPELLRVKYEPIKAEIKKTYMMSDIFVTTEDGEIVDGITVEEREDSITIKVVE